MLLLLPPPMRAAGVLRKCAIRFRPCRFDTTRHIRAPDACGRLRHHKNTLTLMIARSHAPHGELAARRRRYYFAAEPDSLAQGLFEACAMREAPALMGPIDADAAAMFSSVSILPHAFARGLTYMRAFRRLVALLSASQMAGRFDLPFRQLEPAARHTADFLLIRFKFLGAISCKRFCQPDDTVARQLHFIIRRAGAAVPTTPKSAGRGRYFGASRLSFSRERGAFAAAICR